MLNQDLLRRSHTSQVWSHLDIEGVEMHSSALGRLTLRSAMTVNGGAALALVALIGWLAVSEFFAWPIVPLATALAAFSAGVLCATVACGIAYLNQCSHVSSIEGARRWVRSLRLTTFVFVFGSYGAFSVGTCSVYIALVNYSPQAPRSDSAVATTRTSVGGKTPLQLSSQRLEERRLRQRWLTARGDETRFHAGEVGR